MKIFDRDCKVNFVDINNIFVGYDSCQSCCEDFGYYFSVNIIEARELDAFMEQKNRSYNEDLVLDDHIFDTTFFEECDCVGGDQREGVIFKLIVPNYSTKDIYLTLYNSHNGYYSHGFEMRAGVGGTILRSGSL